MLDLQIEIPLSDGEVEAPVPSLSLGSGDRRGRSEVGLMIGLSAG